MRAYKKTKIGLSVVNSFGQIRELEKISLFLYFFLVVLKIRNSKAMFLLLGHSSL